MPKQPTVYLVQENPVLNVLGAQKYGKIVRLFEHGSQLMFSPHLATQRLKRLLKDFNDEDYLLMMGDPAAMGLACCIAADINRGKFKILNLPLLISEAIQQAKPIAAGSPIINR